MNEISVRVVGANDRALFDRVHDDVFDNAVLEDSLTRFLGDPRHVIALALDGDLIVGMCSAFEYFHPDKPPQLFLNELGVAAPYRRRGLGRRLTAAILKEARRRGCAGAWVGTETDNVAARRLFEGVETPDDAQNFVLYEWALEQR